MNPDDRFAVTDCLQRYCARIDELDFRALAAIFTDDADVRYGDHPPMTGGKATAAFLAELCEGIAWHQHFAQTVEIEIDGDTASTTTYFIAHAVRHGDPGVVHVNVGEYRDALIRTEGGWLISARRQRTGWRERRSAG
jgi:ketosteroid isomerase-like protein